MKKQIVNISKLQTAKVMAVLYLIISLPLGLLMLIPMLIAQPEGSRMSLGFLVAMPVLYAVFGFLFTLLGAWIYNGVAGLIGGIEFTMAEVSSD
jgi:hypothetical protein